MVLVELTEVGRRARLLLASCWPPPSSRRPGKGLLPGFPLQLVQKRFNEYLLLSRQP